jgi:hypothetical protein
MAAAGLSEMSENVCMALQGRKSSIQLLQPSLTETLHPSFTVNSFRAPQEKLRNDRELE